MTFDLEFHHKALKEFKNLPGNIQDRLKSKLAERLDQPHVPSAKLTGAANCYKIKMKSPPIRLVYHVSGTTVRVLAVGPRERMAAYLAAKARMQAG